MLAQNGGWGQLCKRDKIGQIMFKKFTKSEAVLELSRMNFSPDL